MRITILAILFFFTEVGFAQNDTLIIANNYKFKIGVKGMFGQSGSSFTPETKPIYNFGMQGIYKIGSTKSSIESGLYYYNRSFDSYYYDINSPLYINSSGYFLNEITYRSLHIPLNYRLDTRIIYLSLGFYTDYLISIDADNISEYKKQNDNPRKFSMGYNFSIGIEKAITQKFSVFIEVKSSSSFRKPSFLSYNNTAIVLYNYGTAIGVNYKILKQ